MFGFSCRSSALRQSPRELVLLGEAARGRPSGRPIAAAGIANGAFSPVVIMTSSDGSPVLTEWKRSIAAATS